jgi:hypothetical protein
MTQPVRSRRRPTADEIEGWAFGLLEQHLLRAGHAVADVRRPDRDNRTSRDVDFLVEVDGRDVAIEVTQLDQARQWWNLLDRLETHIRTALRWEDGGPDAGWLILSINLLRTASYREAERCAAQIIQAIRGASTDLGTRSWESLPDLAEPARSLVEVEVRRPDGPGGKARLTFMNGHEAHDPLIAPRVLAFVQHLLASKGNQAAGYREVWILVIDNELIIDMGEVAAAFAGERDRVPANWARLYFIPATDRTDIQTLDLLAMRAE